MARDYEGDPKDMLIQYRNTDSLSAAPRALSKLEDAEDSVEMESDDSVETMSNNDIGLLEEDYNQRSYDFLNVLAFPEDDSVDKASSD